MCSTPLSEKLENATRRASSKKTKHRVGKKFGTIFSKQSSGEGGRFKKILFLLFSRFLHLQQSKFCIFQLFWFRFPASKLYQSMSQKLYLKCAAVPKQWNFLSFKNEMKSFKNREAALITHVTLKTYSLLLSFFIKNCLVGNCHLYNIHAMFNSRLNFSFKGASNTNIVFIY